MISDPKALKHIYSAPETFSSASNVREILRVMLGPGILAVEGEDHKRQRRVMQPAFGFLHLRSLFPTFVRHSQHVRQRFFSRAR
jgi:cytochrome P450